MDEAPTDRLTEPRAPGWPLVERRRLELGPPGGQERRVDELPEGVPAVIDLPALAPFRWLALALSVVLGIDEMADRSWAVMVGIVLATAYTVIVTLWPIPTRNDQRTRLLVVLEAVMFVALVAATSGWRSPLAPLLIPTMMLAGFVGGLGFAAGIAAAVAALVSAVSLSLHGLEADGNAAAVWTVLIGLVALSSGLSRRAFEESARQQAIAYDRASRLAEANALLFSLQQLAQTLPATLDLDDVLDSTTTQLRTLLPVEALAVLLHHDSDDSWSLARSSGTRLPATIVAGALPPPLRRALSAQRALLVADLGPDGPGVADGSATGLYAALRARGAVVGLIAVESRSPGRYGAQEAEVLTGLVESLGIGIDNARLFQRLRGVAADEERSRIARDLHDRIGSSLALLGFELDRAIAGVDRGADVPALLNDLRRQVTDIVADVREALFDLRTDVSETQDLVTTLSTFLQRVRQRSGLEVSFQHFVVRRPPMLQEREWWNIAREAVTNVEKHAHASRIDIEWWCDGDRSARLMVADDGIGFGPDSGRTDSFGVIGMRERATSIGAHLSITHTAEGAERRGTRVLVTLGEHQHPSMRPARPPAGSARPVTTPLTHGEPG
jgi:signal transduction histidine kinase